MCKPKVSVQVEGVQGNICGQEDIRSMRYSWNWVLFSWSAVMEIYGSGNEAKQTRLNLSHATICGSALTASACSCGLLQSNNCWDDVLDHIVYVCHFQCHVNSLLG